MEPQTIPVPEFIRAEFELFLQSHPREHQRLLADPGLNACMARVMETASPMPTFEQAYLTAELLLGGVEPQQLLIRH
jgi:hypothetical protein